MDDVKTLISTVPISVALAIIFYKIMANAFQAHKEAMKEQRDDLLAHMKTACQARIPPGPPTILLLACILLLPGCAAGQGGALGDFNVVTPLGSLSFKTWTVDTTAARPTTRPIQ